MKTCKTLAVSGLAFAVLTLALAGCEQITSGDFKGPITGSGTSDLVNFEPAPSVKEAGNSIVLTWDPIPVGATFQNVYRYVDGDSEPILIAQIWNEESGEALSEQVKLTGQIEFVDYFTDSAKTYEYDIVGGYHTGSYWEEAVSRKTLSVQGKTNVRLEFEGASNYTYNEATGLLTFTPALPTLDKHNAGIGTTLLFIQDADTSYDYRFDGRVALPAINLIDILKNNASDFAGKMVEISYDAGYKLIKNGTRTITYINHDYGLGPDGSRGSIIEVRVPLSTSGSNLNGTIAVPANFKAEAQNNGSIKLTWNAVPSVTGYEIHYAAAEDGNYDHWDHISVVPGTSTEYIDSDVELWENWYYKIKAFAYTPNGIAYSYLSEAVNARSAVSGGGIALQNNQWATGNIGSSPQYYTFNATNGTAYYIQWDDSYLGTGAYSGDVKVSASYSDSDNTEIFPAIDTAYDSPQYFVASKTGGIVIKVEGYDLGYTGSYAIRYYTVNGGNTGETLVAPTGVSATAQSDGSIRIEWNSVNGAIGYGIYFATSANGNYYYYPPDWTEDTVYLDWDVSPGDTWYYKVLAYNDSATGPLSDYTFATALGANSVELSYLLLTSAPDKTLYTAGEAFSTAGLVVTAYYSDGSAQTVTNSSVLTHNGDTIANGNTAITASSGNKTVTVSYGDRTIDFSITVEAAVVTCAVTFNADGGYPTPDSRTVAFGDTLGWLPEIPVRNGYAFGGWFSQQNGGGTQYTEYYPAITGDVILYAKWTANQTTNAMPLTNNVWTIGNLTSNTVNYYSFTVSSGTAYYIQWDDSYDGAGSYSGDIKVYASYNDAYGTEIFPMTDSGYGTPQFFVSSQSYSVIIRVEGFSPGSTGSYAIRYYTGLAAPTGVAATAQPDGSIVITWNPVDGATGYEVYWADAPYGEYYFFNHGWFDEPVFTHWGLNSGDTWYYKALAYNNSAISPLSNYAYATALEAIPGAYYPYNVITLPGGNGNYSLSPGHPEMWFEFYVSSPGSYHNLHGSDTDNSSFGADIVADVYDSDLNLVYHVDIGADYIDTTWNSGWYYVKVTPYNGYSDNTGTFAIAVD
jgi:uncharacterized repeat protein (TIGR02543 family)